jgi:hypothetical protein
MRDIGFWTFLLVLTTRGTPVRLRIIVSIMLFMAAFLLLISFIGGGLRPMPLWYITLAVLLFGVAQYLGPRVRCNLRLWYPQKVKRFERFEGWALWAFFIYLGVHLIFT